MKTRSILILAVSLLIGGPLFSQNVMSKLLKKSISANRELVFSDPSTTNPDTKCEFNFPNFEETLESLLAEIWTIKTSYSFVPGDNIKDHINENKEKVLRADFSTVSTFYEKGQGDFREIVTNEFRVTLNKMSRLDIIRIYLPDDINKADLVYAIKSTEFIFRNIDKFKNKYIFKDSAKLFGNQLKSKTLLIPESVLNDKLNASIISKSYPHKFKIVSDEAIDQAIMEMDEEHLVIYQGNFVNSGSAVPIWFVYQPSDGAIVSYAVSKFSIGGFGKRASMKEKDIKQLTVNTK